MTLLEIINNSISDETSADNEYEKMIELVKSEDSLSDADKALISTMLIKIETDEETHNLMLKIIRDVLTKGGDNNDDE